VAKALAAACHRIDHLRCYEGSISPALYEWNYQRQLQSIQAHRSETPTPSSIKFSKNTCWKALLAAIRRGRRRY
jgi:hypothetical protein